MTFDESGQLTAPMWFANDQDGRVIAFARAHTTLTAGTPYRIKYDEYGPFTAALANDQDTYRVGIAKTSTKTGEIAELVHGGPYAGVVTASITGTVGYAAKVSAGAVASEGSDFDDLHDNMFGAFYTTQTGTSQDIIMVPEVITAT